MIRSAAFAALLLAAVSVLALRRAAPPRSLPVYSTADLTPAWPTPGERAGDHRVGAFRLVDQTGRPVTESVLDGHATVVSFFYAECTTLCPSLKTQLARVQDAFAGDAGVQILSHTVQADSVAALRAYAAVNGVRAPQWRLLTGPRETITALARTNYFAPVADDGSLHTETFWLVDGERRIRGVYNGTLAVDVDQLIADVRALRREG